MRPGSSLLLALTTFRAPVRLTGPSILLYYEPAVSSTFVLFDLPFGRFLSITHYPADDLSTLTAILIECPIAGPNLDKLLALLLQNVFYYILLHRDGTSSSMRGTRCDLLNS